MKILVVGGSGLIGKAVVEEFKDLDHEVIVASRESKEQYVDLSKSESIEEMFQNQTGVDAVVSTVKGIGQIDDLKNLQLEDFQEAFKIKGFGQINLVLIGQKYLNPKGSFTLTTGILSAGIVPQTCTVTTVNNAVEGFVKGSSTELERNLRINAVSPNVISEVVEKFQAKSLFLGFEGVPLKKAATAYVRSVLGKESGEVIQVW